MSANPKSDSLTMTEAEYLEFERNSEIRHEYINGEVYAMTGESPNHNRLVMALSIRLGSHVMGKHCEAFGENQKIKIKKSKDKKYLYADLIVVCDEPDFNDENPQALLNPILIIEVLSPSTEKFDRDEKFTLYCQLDSLREYVLVSQESAKIERYYLLADKIWEFTDSTRLESSIRLKSIDCTLSLADVYANVVFEDEST